jgi:hypothetical protein
MEIYANEETIKTHYPDIELGLKEKHSQLDSQISKIAKEKKYSILREWKGYPVYKIPTEDLLGIRSAIYCRRLGSYRYFIQEALNNTLILIPLICFVGGDFRLRVKSGNLIYWVAKETKKISFLECVFPGNPEETDALIPEQLKLIKVPESTFA